MTVLIEGGIVLVLVAVAGGICLGLGWTFGYYATLILYKVRGIPEEHRQHELALLTQDSLYSDQ